MNAEKAVTDGIPIAVARKVTSINALFLVMIRVMKAVLDYQDKIYVILYLD